MDDSVKLKICNCKHPTPGPTFSSIIGEQAPSPTVNNNFQLASYLPMCTCPTKIDTQILTHQSAFRKDFLENEEEFEETRTSETFKGTDKMFEEILKQIRLSNHV